MGTFASPKLWVWWVLALAACSVGNAGGFVGGGGDGGRDGALDGGGGTSTFDRDAACAQVSADGTLVKKPVDIIFVIDNSGSMTEEITEVQKNINNNFAQIIGASGLDYRVIMISRHGSATGSQSICVSAPLSGNTTCSPPPQKPTNGARYFHYSVEISSNNSLSQIVSTYNKADEHNLAPNGWQAWLRPDAIKVFLEITDDESSTSSTNFETALFRLTPKMFGDASNRNYIFHSITGLANNSPATKPWAPSDPIQNGTCGAGAVNEGEQYQNLSRLTGGLRFPICQYASFDAVFQNIAMGVVKGAQVACEFEIPVAPAGQMVSLDTVIVEYTPSAAGAAAQTFAQVSDAAQCKPGAFFLSGGKIVLCPDTCTQVKADTMAKVRVLFDCAAPLS